MRRGTKLAGLALAALPLMGMSCDQYIAESSMRAVRMNNAQPAGNEIIPMPGRHPNGNLQMSCPGPTLTVSNPNQRPFGLAATYGSTQAPLVFGSQGGVTIVSPGTSYNINLAPAVGSDVLVFLDNGAVGRIESVEAC